MHCEDRERACLLIDGSLVAGISAEDRRWLDSHVAGCAECAEFARDTARMLAGLNTLSFECDPAMNRRVTRAAAVHAGRKPWRPAAWIAAAAVILAAGPLYRNFRERQQERQDTLLMDTVAARISQTVPEALEPLRAPEVEAQ